MRRIVGTLGVAALATGLLSGTGPAAAGPRVPSWRTPGSARTAPTFVDGGALALVRSTPTARSVAVVGRDGALALARELAEAPERVEDVLASTDRTSVLVAGRALPSADGASPDVSIWCQPLDGSPAEVVSGHGSAGTFEATVGARAAAAPVVERRTRTPR
ncbi:hypothetical protein [Kineococcus sp. SYSU DK003]|uniref:hypothetical protein n=1 Tax=Kineococcus sp. SYSU DK003 TaxID=3383124 RepID=UPI003D7DEEDA